MTPPRVDDGMQLEIRTLGRGDAAESARSLAALHLDAIESGMALGRLLPVEIDELTRHWHSVVSGLSESRTLLVAETAERVVAMGQLVRNEAENARHRGDIEKVAVAAAERGKGVGRLMMASLEELARRDGISLVCLSTHADTNTAAIYEHLGYTCYGILPDYSRRPDGTLWPGAFFYRRL